MSAETSFLEKNSFADLPPLRKIDGNFSLQLLSTVDLCDFNGVKIEISEIGKSSEKKYVTSSISSVFLDDENLLILDRGIHRVLVVKLARMSPFFRKLSIKFTFVTK